MTGLLTSRPALRIAAIAILLAALAAAASTAAGASRGSSGRASRQLLHVVWMRSYAARGTPARLNRVGVLEIGRPRARNVLVFEPGTSAGSAYIVPFAQWLVRKLPGWQVWSVERRENLLEDQSMLTLAKEHRATPTQVFNYYLGWLNDPAIRHHVKFLSPTSDGFAKDWGLNVAMQDLRVVITAAHRLGGRVVLSGHSLGGGLVTAYATWDFGGRPGADGLAGLVFDDGASFGRAVSATQARKDLSGLMAHASSPWGGVSSGSLPAPLLGLFSTTGSLAAVLAPDQPSVADRILPASLKPPVPLTNLALFAYNTDVATSVLGRADFAILAHEGRGIAATTIHGAHTWDARGALTPPARYAAMLAGPGVAGADGVEWYFPYRLTLDLEDALNNGIANPAQKLLGVRATMGRRLPRTLRMYAFGAAGGSAIDTATRQLAVQSHIPLANLTLVNRHGTYAHNDPAGAYPHNAFFTGLIRFLQAIAR